LLEEHDYLKNTMITQNTLEEFLDALASRSPTPGGGSAAALIGAMGAGLISMVCNVTLGKKGMEEVASEMRAVCTESEALRLRLTAMIAEDIAAFDALMSAYRLPKGNDAEKAQRGVAIQNSLIGATNTPLRCARACADVIKLSRRAAQLGYSGVISDAGVGVLAAQTALRGAALNVEINAPLLEDRAFAAEASNELKGLLELCGRESEAVFALVRTRLG
jgi:methenyltetrahydrofolate cyclohydrolase